MQGGLSHLHTERVHGLGQRKFRFILHVVERVTEEDVDPPEGAVFKAVFVIPNTRGYMKNPKNFDKVKPNPAMVKFLSEMTGLPFQEELENPKADDEDMEDYCRRILSRMKGTIMILGLS